MPMSNSLRNAVLDLLLGATSMTPAATYWVALYTVAPDATGGGTECAGGSYARVEVTNSSGNWTDNGNGAKYNGLNIVFPEATAAWGTVVAVGLHDHATNDALQFFATISPGLVVDAGDQPRFTQVSGKLLNFTLT